MSASWRRVRVYDGGDGIYIEMLNGDEVIELHRVEGRLADMTLIDMEIMFNLVNILVGLYEADAVYEAPVVARWNALKRAANQS